MGAIDGTKVKLTEFAGKQKLLLMTATVAASSDTITLTEADHGISEITGILGVVVTGGLDAAFTSVQASFSGLVITIKSLEQDGTAATDFTGTTITVTVIGK